MPDLLHRCVLGDTRGVPDGTLRRGATCEHWWRLVPTYLYWTDREWAPVRWWQWRLRRYIRQAVTEEADR
jgi:hypothetical protein